MGSWMGLVGLSMVFSFHFVFYLIYRGGHLNRLGKTLIYRDLSFKVVVKTISINVFCPPRLCFSRFLGDHVPCRQTNALLPL